MHIYDNLMIGSGYSSLGYALANQNSIICEQYEACDTHFYLPMKHFSYSEYIPETEYGKKLFEMFSAHGLFSDAMQNVNCFESVFCSFISDSDAEILIKCRVVEVKTTQDGIHEVTVITNSGLESIYAKNVIDTRSTSAKERFLTVLYVSENPDEDRKKLEKEFDGAYIENAFYRGRYSLYIPCGECENINAMRLDICTKWKQAFVEAKILYMASVSGVHNANIVKDEMPNDDWFSNPIEAFEAGYFYAKEH